MIVSLDEDLISDFKQFVIEYLEKHRGEKSTITAKTIINRFVCYKAKCGVPNLHRSHFLEDHHISKQRLHLILLNMSQEGLIKRDKSTHKVKYAIRKRRAHESVVR